MTIRRVRKRDGREVPFDLTKIKDAVARAQAAVSEDEPEFAHEVAQIVGLALASRRSRISSSKR
jgi:anaerobic ribonucleoside-triphosphate reductase